MLIQSLFRQKSDLVIHGDVAAGGGLGGIVRGVIHLDFAVADLLQNGVVLVQGESAEVPACFVGGQANIVALFQAKVAVGASDEDRETLIREAVADGANTIVCVGYLYGPALAWGATEYPDVHFIAVDVNGLDIDSESGTIPENVF